MKKILILSTIISLILIVILNGCIEITSRDNGDSFSLFEPTIETIDVRELNEHPNKYFGKNISVRGDFRKEEGHYVITPNTVMVNYVVYLEIPSSVDTTNLILYEEYYFTGIPNYGVFTAFGEGGKRYGDNLYLKVNSIEPVHKASSGYLSVPEILSFPASYVNNIVGIKGDVNSDLSAIGEYQHIRIKVPSNYPDTLVPNAEYELRGFLELNYDGIPSSKNIEDYLIFYVKNNGNNNEVYATPISSILNDESYLNQSVIVKARHGSSVSLGIASDGRTYTKKEIVDESNGKINAIIFENINDSILDNWQLIWFYWLGVVIEINNEIMLEVAYIFSNVDNVDVKSLLASIESTVYTSQENNGEEEKEEEEYIEGNLVSIYDLIHNPDKYHNKHVVIRGCNTEITDNNKHLFIYDCNDNNIKFSFKYPEGIEFLKGEDYYWYGVILVTYFEGGSYTIDFNVDKVDLIS